MARGWAARPSGDRAARPRTVDESREYARELCLRRLAIRPRTRAELETVLRDNGVDIVVAREVLDRYDEVGLIDDEAFARAWVASRHHGKGLARRALARELRNKGVADETVGQALAEVNDSTEAETARALVARKLRSSRGDRPDALFRRLVGMLARKGYAPGLAIAVVREALSEVPEIEELADSIDVDACNGMDGRIQG